MLGHVAQGAEAWHRRVGEARTVDHLRIESGFFVEYVVTDHESPARSEYPMCRVECCLFLARAINPVVEHAVEENDVVALTVGRIPGKRFEAFYPMRLRRAKASCIRRGIDRLEDESRAAAKQSW